MNDIRAGNSDNDYERGREGRGRNLITTIPIVKPLFPINTTIPQYIYIRDIDSLSFVKIDSKIGRLNLRPGLRLTIEISFRKIDRFEIHKQCPNERARTRAWILKVCVCSLRGSFVENVAAEIEGLRLSIEPGSLA